MSQTDHIHKVLSDFQEHLFYWTPFRLNSRIQCHKEKQLQQNRAGINAMIALQNFILLFKQS